MSDPSDNPYAAPRAPPEKENRLPVSAYAAAIVAGITMFFAMLVLASGAAVVGTAFLFPQAPSLWPYTEQIVYFRVALAVVCVSLSLAAGLVMSRKQLECRRQLHQRRLEMMREVAHRVESSA